MHNRDSNRTEAKAATVPDTATRRLEHEALGYAVSLLATQQHDIQTALYLTYMKYRERFIEERGLMDSPPGAVGWEEALSEARSLERAVNQAWAQAILAAFPPASGSDHSALHNKEPQ